MILLLLFGQSFFGVDESRLDGTDRYLVAGKPVPRERVYQLIGGPAWPDASRWRVTVIGEGRDAVLDDFVKHPALAKWRDACHVRGYDAGHWHLAAGFVVSGKPTLYVQSADGAVLHRQDDYAGGAESLAAALEAAKLRKPPPDYKPEADRDLRRRLIPPLVRVPWGACAACGLGLIAVGLLYRRRS